MKKLSLMPAPLLAGVVREKTKAAAIAQIKNCYLDGADMIDLHLSCLEDPMDLKAIFAASKLPVLALHYKKTYDWKDMQVSEEARVDAFLRAMEAGAAGIDMQGYTFDEASRLNFRGEDKYSFTKGNPREIVTDERIIEKQCALIEKVHALGGEVLLSCHPGVPLNARQVTDLALFLEKRGSDIIKIVTPAGDDPQESIRAMLSLKKEVRTPVAYHCNGKGGIFSRILNPILGGQIAFCVDGYDAGSTMEQIDLKTARAVIANLEKLR